MALKKEAFFHQIHFGPESENAASKIMYSKMNESIELMSLVMNIIMSLCAPSGIVPPFLLLSAINYFIYDLGPESFILPWPVEYVG